MQLSVFWIIRCGIPVVIMGETGCGKTRLIRFMCDLAAQGSGKRNMLILKASREYLVWIHINVICFSSPPPGAWWNLRE